MSILIKRYPNRKLYDTVEKQYVTLDGINDLIRQGEEIKVIDNVTGEDLTAVILSQVILDNEKKRNGFLPRAVLTGLIQSGGTTLDTVRWGMSNSFDTLSHIDDEIKRRVSSLTESGDLSLTQANELIQKLIAAGQHRVDLFLPLENAMRKVISERGIVSRSELHDLASQVERLSAQLDELGQQKQMEDQQSDK
jgi:polyhydroxyalkanoate synthesis repressor PhaR